MASDTQTTIDHLNNLLRGEISAAETYKMALDKMDHSDELAFALPRLRDIQREHGVTAQALRSRIQQLGGSADNDSGAWGAWAQFVQGTANLLGDKASLKSLKEGEEHGLKDYERTLDEGIDAETRTMLMDAMARQREHIAELDRLMSA